MLRFLGKKIRELFKGKVDEAAIERLEEIFYQADLGSEISAHLTEKVRLLYKKKPDLTTEEILQTVKQDLLAEIIPPPVPTFQGQPHVILIVGVNGNGKTTSIAKLAHHFHKGGKTLLIAAADTFRVAATEQLEKWVAPLGIELVRGKPGGDPAAVVFDAITAAKTRGLDIVLIDTAGRLHTKTDLMRELEKIYRVSGKAEPKAPHETWLVLDATIGQNGVEQAMIFHKFTPLSGLILTKMDGTAKGGAAFAIQKKLNLPIVYMGT